MVYLGIDVGIPWLSNDGGLSFKPIGHGLAHISHTAQRQMIRIAVSHQDPGVAFFMTLDGGMWGTIDAGKSYYRIGTFDKTGINGTGNVRGGQLIGVSPTSHANIVFFAQGKWWVSGDQGLSFHAFPTPIELAEPVATAWHVNADGTGLTLWVGHSNELYRYTFGESQAWEECAMNGFPPGQLPAGELSSRNLWSSVEWMTTKPVLLMMGSDRVTYWSFDRGDTWAPVPNSPVLPGQVSLWCNPWNHLQMCVNEHPKLGFMTDSGGAGGWQPQCDPSRIDRRGEQVGAIECHGWEYTPQLNTVYMRNGYALFKSDNGGRLIYCVSQHRISAHVYRGMGAEAGFCNAIMVNGAGQTFISDQDQGILRADVAARDHWRCTRYAINEGLESDHPALRGKSIWNTDSVAGWLIEQAYMLAWITGRTLSPDDVEAFAHCWGPDVWKQNYPSDRHCIYKSLDGDLFKFHTKYANFPWQWNALADNLIVDPTSPTSARVYYVCTPAGIWKSIDGAKTFTQLKIGNLPIYSQRGSWEKMRSRFAHVRIHPNDPNVLYATTVRSTNAAATGQLLSGIYRSIDKGKTWTPLTSPIQSCWAFTIAPTGVLYAADRDMGLFASYDNAVSWVQEASIQRITAIVCERLAPASVWIASDCGYNWNGIWGVFRRDGNSWTDVSDTLPHLRIVSMVEDPLKNGRMLIGTRGAGAWALEAA